MVYMSRTFPKYELVGSSKLKVSIFTAFYKQIVQIFPEAAFSLLVLHAWLVFWLCLFSALCIIGIKSVDNRADKTMTDDVHACQATIDMLDITEQAN